MTAREIAVEKAVSLKGQRNSIVDIYNTYTPHPRRYKVKYDDMLCATYVSAIFIALGWTDIVPPECGAHQLYNNMEALGHAVADPKRVPNIGDLIFFGQGTKTSAISHVGIVTEVVNNNRIYYYDVTYVAGRHTCPVGYSWITAYGTPDYASKDVPATTPSANPAPKAEFKAGDLVNILPGATWYRGSSIKASVLPQSWYIVQVKGDRAVLGMNLAETSNIQSPINVKYLVHALPQVETPPEEIKMEVQLTMKVLQETSDKLYAMSQQTGKDIGAIIDSLVMKESM